MRLNRRIQFYKKSSASTRDVYGQRDDAETLVGTAWARMVTTIGDESIESGQIVSSAKTKFTCRFRSDVYPGTHTIHYDDAIYQIKSVREINKYGRKKYIEILTTSGDGSF